MAFNISKSEEKMNIKQCADVLFAMANLSFYDEVSFVYEGNSHASSAPNWGCAGILVVNLDVILWIFQIFKPE